MSYINYILFIIFLIGSVRCAFARSIVVSSPLDGEHGIELDGFELLWIILFPTGLIALSAPGGVDLMAIRLLVLELQLLFIIFIYKDRLSLSAAMSVYLIYLVWILIGCLYGHCLFMGIRVFLKYLYPIIVAIAASVIVMDIRLWLKSVKIARWVGIAGLLYYSFGFFERFLPGLFWYYTAGAVNFISLMCVSAGLSIYSDERIKNTLWTILWFLPCVIWALRSSILGSLIALCTFFTIRYRFKSIPLIMITVASGVCILLFSPTVREKTFSSPDISPVQMISSGTFDSNVINTNARASMWEHLWDQFFVKAPLVGCGTGSVQNYLYSNNLFHGLKVPHNDYLQIACDNGIIGLILYIVATSSAIIHCYRVYKSSHSSEYRLIAISAGASLAGVAATMLSENTVNYSMATTSLSWGLYGMMNGIINKSINFTE